MDDEIADRACGHIQTERLPVVAVVERDEDGALRAAKQQPSALVIFAHRVDRIIGQPSDDLRPRLAAVARAIDVRVHIIKAYAIDGDVSNVTIKMAGVNLRDFTPGGKPWRRHVRPRLAAVACDVYQPVIGSGPYHVAIFVRRAERIDY